MKIEKFGNVTKKNRDKKERGGYQKEKKNESVCQKESNLNFK